MFARRRGLRTEGCESAFRAALGRQVALPVLGTDRLMLWAVPNTKLLDRPTTVANPALTPHWTMMHLVFDLEYDFLCRLSAQILRKWFEN